MGHSPYAFRTGEQGPTEERPYENEKQRQDRMMTASENEKQRQDRMVTASENEKH